MEAMTVKRGIKGREGGQERDIARRRRAKEEGMEAKSS